MKLSLRTRLFLSLTALLLFFTLLSWGLTSTGLEDYYYWQKKAVLIQNCRQIDELYAGNPEDISLDLERIGNTLGAGIVIIAQDNSVKYSSFGRIINAKFQEPFPPPLRHGNENNPPSPRDNNPRRPPAPVVKSKETIDSRTKLEIQHSPELNLDSVVLEYQLRNGDLLLLRQPLAPVWESAGIAAQFIAWTGLLSILLGSLWAYFFARKFTSPILELKQIAQNMSQLDFSKTCTINRTDEIGELGNSINHLSAQLGTAIAELHQKNQQLMADVEKERKLDKMRQDFVSSVSHELKTPLSLLLGYAEGLKENIAGNEEDRNFYCSVIIDEAEKMDRLVKDLLNLSQIESGFFKLNQSNFDLSALLSDIALKYQSLLAEKQITLIADIPKQLQVFGDPLRIEQILCNLVNNALDHTEGARRLQIKAEDTGSHIRVSVFNTGQPIPSESLDKIWLSFYKVDKSRSREHGGYGLGLSIVRAIQELHGNAYGVTNHDQGVSFWFDVTNAKSG